MDEVRTMTSDCAEMFFKQDDIDRSRDPLVNKNFQVHRVGVVPENSSHSKKFPEVSMSRPS